MQIETATTYRYALRFAEGFPGQVRSREGLLLVVRRADGEHRLAELAPWPAFDAIDLDRAEASLHAALRGESCELVGPADWCLHCARFLDNTSEELPPHASLIWASDDASFRATLSAAAERNAPAIKLKVGRDPAGVDEARLDAIRSACPRSELRLDANRTLGAEDVRRLHRAWERYDIGFWEEPCRDFDDLRALALDGIPIALDESLLHERDKSELDAFHAFVLKASLLGVARSEALAQYAHENRIRILVSSVFESCVGRAALAGFAYRVAPDEAHGLGTARYLAEDFDLESLRDVSTLDASLTALVAAGQLAPGVDVLGAHKGA